MHLRPQRGLLTTLYNVAVAYEHLGDHTKAKALCDEIIGISEHPGQENWRLAAYALDLKATIAEAQSKDWRAAIALRERALTNLSHDDDAFLHAWLDARTPRRG